MNSVYSHTESTENRNAPMWLKKVRIVDKINKLVVHSNNNPDMRKIEVIMEYCRQIDSILAEILFVVPPADQIMFKKYAFSIHSMLEICTLFFKITFNGDTFLDIGADHPLNAIIVRYPIGLSEIFKSIFEDEYSILKA